MRITAAATFVICLFCALTGMKAQPPAAVSTSGAAVQAARGTVVAGRGGEFSGHSLSVRTPEQNANTTLAANLLGWHSGVRTDVFGPLTFSEAAAKADAAGMADVEGLSTQQVSREIPRTLDYNLSESDVKAVKARLNELRLRMPAYFAASVPGDQISRRKLFEFAKNLGADVIICSPETATLVDLDKLANELTINVAVVNGNPMRALAGLQGLSKRVGVSADLGEWLKSGIHATKGLALLKDRVLAADLSGMGTAESTLFLLELSRLQPPRLPSNYPPPPGHDGSGEKAEGRPLFFRLDPAADLSAAAQNYTTAVIPALAYRVDELARLTPMSSFEKVPADQKERIDHAIPRQAVVKAKHPRTLLVLDLAINGSFYHGSAPLGNLSLTLMSKYTGAFTPVFSNDLDNLKYPKIKQYDAVFLNQIQGDVFVDPKVIGGLTRYVREGGGVAGLHASTWASQNVHQFGEMMGATSGAHKYNGEQGALRIDDPKSPITRQFQGKPFEFFDEFYHYIPSGPYSREKVHVLLSLDPARKDLTGNQYSNRPDGDYGMVWIKSYGKGRVFNVGLGHRPEFYESPNMQKMVLGGIQFVLGDIKVDTAPGNRPVSE